VATLPETNIVFADTTLAAHVIVTKLQSQGVLCSAMGENKVRFVTHLDVGRSAIDRACAILAKIS
jgi:threonine aldolase